MHDKMPAADDAEMTARGRREEKGRRHRHTTTTAD